MTTTPEVEALQDAVYQQLKRVIRSRRRRSSRCRSNAVLSRQGFGHVTAALPAGDIQVRFVRTGITPGATVGRVHERYPDTAATFAAHGIDLCCGGGKTLEFVSKARGVELARLLAELQQAAVKP